jgi:hypothetical protein
MPVTAATTSAMNVLIIMTKLPACIVHYFRIPSGGKL